MQMEELVDRIRWTIEECDYLAGLQVLLDAEGMYGGVANVILENIRDDFSATTPIISYHFSSTPVKLPFVALFSSFFVS